MTVHVPPGTTGMGIWTPEFGDRVRIGVLHEGKWRPMLWTSVSEDGSVHLGLRYLRVETMKMGSTEARDGPAFVDYSQGRPVDEPALRANPKVTFHSSGALHAPGTRGVRFPGFRALARPLQVAVIIFEPPAAYAPDRVRPRDIVIDYPVEPGRSLVAYVVVEPLPSGPVLMRPRDGLAQQFHIAMEYQDLDGVPDLLLWIELCDGPAGPWPPFAYVAFQTIDGSL